MADPSFALGTLEGISRLVECEGAGSIFKGMPAILAKQLPYTIVQLCGFELITWAFYSWDATAAFLNTYKGGLGQWLVSFGSAMITVRSSLRHFALSRPALLIWLSPDAHPSIPTHTHTHTRQQAVFASLASQPGDVILSRVNKDRSSQPVLDTMKETVRELGIRGLFKGTVSACVHPSGVSTVFVSGSGCVCSSHKLTTPHHISHHTPHTPQHNSARGCCTWA